MKKLILAACALTCAASVFGQGQVTFNNRVVGSIVSHIYGPNPTDASIILQGNGTGDTAAGTTDWSAYPLLNGANGTYTVQLWAAPGAFQPENSLVAVPVTTSMRTGAAAGFIAGITVVVPNVPGDTTGGPATFEVRVWDNVGGTITSWSAANAAGVALGNSPIFTVNGPLGGGVVLPPNLVGLQSFNIHGTIVPEPSTFALAGLGAAALLIFRRRK
jgi:hypothetical protein